MSAAGLELPPQLSSKARFLLSSCLCEQVLIIIELLRLEGISQVIWSKSLFKAGPASRVALGHTGVICS